MLLLAFSCHSSFKDLVGCALRFLLGGWTLCMIHADASGKGARAGARAMEERRHTWRWHYLRAGLWRLLVDRERGCVVVC